MCQACRLLQNHQFTASKYIFHCKCKQLDALDFLNGVSLFFWVFLINHHSTRTFSDHGENTVNLWGSALGWNWRHLYAVCRSIPKNKTAHSDGESWIYSDQCNSLNPCSCPFIIINQRAAGPKEQFRALQSYAIAESVISLRKIIYGIIGPWGTLCVKM